MREFLIVLVNMLRGIGRKRIRPLRERPDIPGRLVHVKPWEWEQLTRGTRRVRKKELNEGEFEDFTIDFGKEIRRWTSEELEQEALILDSIEARNGCKRWNQWRKKHPDIRINFWKYVELPKSDLRGIDLSGADLREANFSGADLRQANLRGAILCESNFQGADLRESDLRGADFRKCNLRGADLRNADIRGICLIGSLLAGARLEGVKSLRRL